MPSDSVPDSENEPFGILRRKDIHGRRTQKTVLAQRLLSVACPGPMQPPQARSSPDMSRRPVINYQHGYEFPLPPEGIWDALEEVDQFALWWPWLEDFRLEGDSLATGAVLHGVVAPPLPYRMRIQIELTRCEKPGIIEALVHRDLEGRGEYCALLPRSRRTRRSRLDG